MYFCTRFFANDAIATVAQLVEQRIRNAWVGGSSPPSVSEEGFGLLFLCLYAVIWAAKFAIWRKNGRFFLYLSKNMQENLHYYKNICNFVGFYVQACVRVYVYIRGECERENIQRVNG